MTLTKKEVKRLRELGIEPKKNKGNPVITVAWKPLLIGLSIGLIIFIIMILRFI